MIKLSKKKLAVLLASMFAVSATPGYIYADEAEEAESAEESSESADEEEEETKITVLGSRLQKETFDSISPLQVITTEETLNEGLLDTASIVQNAVSSAGQQIDLTFTGFVLDNGPGASTADLRGLGASRTLVLLNGRRVAPSGVEGAPNAPDLNLLPSGLIGQYEFLTDGASSIYGSDAVAGVVNAKLRKDFDGFEIDAFTRIPSQGGGEEGNLVLTWGQNYDRGFIGAGLEYSETKIVRRADRDWTDQCATPYEITTDGEIRTNDLFYSNVLGQKTTPCIPDRLVGRVIVPTFAGSIYYTPGFSSGGWQNFSEATLFSVNVDSDGDGIADVSYIDYTPNGSEDQQNSALFPAQDRLSFMTYGEYTFDTDSNLTTYFEAGYSKRNFEVQSGNPQLFPVVPADNPYNLCNPNGLPGWGVDCGLAEDSLFLDNANYRSAFFNRYGAFPEQFGLLNGAIGPVTSQPVVAVRGDRNFTKTEIEQTRIVVGATADLPFNISGVPDWSIDTYWSYTKSEGKSARSGIRNDRLQQGLDAEIVNGQAVCRDPSNGCVPINLFAPSLYEGVVGDFASQAERDFVFDSRDFDTTIEQTIAHAFISGSLAQTDAGDIMMGIGMEYRVDEILSEPDDIARDGLFFGFFSDGGAAGDRWVQEAFAELFIPLVKGQPLIEELNLEIAGRYTQDEFYPSATTRSIKLGWRPVSSLLLRGTQGTSYRAPNLRELFLRGSTGFNTLFDPCAVPGDAVDPVQGGYNPALDTRAPEVITNCQNNGVDPFFINIDGRTGTSFSTEVLTGGAVDISEERSESETYGFSWRQPFSNDFELSIGATWYEISINNTIISPSAQFIINDCYTNPNLNSTFCGRIQRDPDTLQFDIIDQSFINRDNETAKGVDININWSSTIDTFGEPVAYSMDIVANHPHERSFTFIDESTGQTNFDDVIGEFGFPDWRAQAQLGARFGNWSLSWGIRYISDVEQDPAGIDLFSDINDSQGTGFIGDTCLGPDEGDVLCRDVGFAASYVTHSMSVTYFAEDWSLRFGLSNVFDKEPPLVDGNEILSLNNAPIGYGYDLNGQVAFLSFSTSL
jgi:iron complex outermembrane receptor protein